MSGQWDKVQRLELELADKDAQLRSLRLEVGALLRVAARHAIDRDTARAVAVRLEQELAYEQSRVVNVPIVGTAT